MNLVLLFDTDYFCLCRNSALDITHFDYVLECDHTAIADVITSDDALRDAYHTGSVILCPDCGYKRRKVIKETQSQHVV